jgi:hypothetical protein
MLKNEDYYFNEEGLMVFTKAYHLKRGFCCGNKCLHCPYAHENVPECDTQNIISKKAKITGNEEK